MSKKGPVERSIDTTGAKKRRFKNQEAYEQYMIGLAYDLVEERLLNGTATSQETTHLLKMGSAREQRAAKLEEMQIELMQAKKESLEANKRLENMWTEGFEALKSYLSPATASLGGEDDHE